ncbi:unnamed protein product [Citrullus colocynthis]|uniref:Uncharacterized protein n=1 Tax=Citrullus colocynthis TaxID=252529 RepID=A0ABP0XSG7_9ROSI
MGAVQMSQVLEFVPRTITKLMNAQLWCPFDRDERMFEVGMVDAFGLYLGMSSLVSCSKSSDFRHTQERVWKNCLRLEGRVFSVWMDIRGSYSACGAEAVVVWEGRLELSFKIGAIFNSHSIRLYLPSLVAMLNKECLACRGYSKLPFEWFHIFHRGSKRHLVPDEILLKGIVSLTLPPLKKSREECKANVASCMLRSLISHLLPFTLLRIASDC